ncbi:hypothetical protein [Polyangium sorediatum]|uniref:ABC transporter permease n=1 Tax=Polyangium sorediatum TaxID=889274 RepID=A0ABT6NJH3_9BACT|nr:hypothetical protein [Polyangium sorediatum]MDI1428459.1 hypothetical protein [Polyangium sorediatum]
MTETASLRDYFLLEARHAPRRAPIVAALVGGLGVLGTHALLVRFPARALHFLEQAFDLRGLASVLLINDLMAAYFAPYFVGLAGLLGAIVTAREEGQLEVLLAKPIHARVLLAARVGPILGAAALTGAAIAIATGLSILPHLAPGDMVSAAGALGGGLFLTAFALLLLALLLPLLVRMRDAFHALLVGSLVWLLPLMPTAVMIYRPDVYEGRAALRSAITLPSLVWHDAAAAWIGPLGLILVASLCALFVRIAGHVLERTDTR